MRRSAKGFPRAVRGRAYGVGVTNSSGARVGITDATTPAGNLIENNGLDGINLSNGSNANLHGNTIQGNGRDGVNVGRSSLRLIGANTIRANTVRGVTVSQGGGCSRVPATFPCRRPWTSSRRTATRGSACSRAARRTSGWR